MTDTNPTDDFLNAYRRDFFEGSVLPYMRALRGTGTLHRTQERGAAPRLARRPLWIEVDGAARDYPRRDFDRDELLR